MQGKKISGEGFTSFNGNKRTKVFGEKSTMMLPPGCLFLVKNEKTSN